MMIPSLGRHRLARRPGGSAATPYASVSLVGEDYPAQAGLADAAKSPAREGAGAPNLIPLSLEGEG